MRQPTQGELLTIWDEAGSRHPVRRALLLLASMYPDVTGEGLARLPIGQRDDRLLALRERLFGSAMTSLVDCPACAARLELTVNVADLRRSGAAAIDDEHTVTRDGYEVRFRLPDSHDLLAVSTMPDVASAEAELLERCLLSARLDESEIAAEELPGEVVSAIADAMERADPLGNVELTPACRSCGHEWRLALDITSFLWDEITAWAMRTLREVHALASRYGWSEADILAMSPRRRQLYLELVAL